MAAPYLQRIWAELEGADTSRFPFTVPAFRDGVQLRLKHPVTFFVGENGTGKSTLLEAIADKCGFHPHGGNRNHLYQRPDFDSPLAPALRLGWQRKTSHGFFFRAESFFLFANFIDSDPELAGPYGEAPLDAQSHGESFLALFQNKFRNGIFLLDEPEAALSPQRQLAFLSILHDLETSGGAQFIIATHSPLLFSYPGATVLEFSDRGLSEVDPRDTEHFQLMRRFLDNPGLYFHHLFDE